MPFLIFEMHYYCVWTCIDRTTKLAPRSHLRERVVGANRTSTTLNKFHEIVAGSTLLRSHTRASDDSIVRLFLIHDVRY